MASSSLLALIDDIATILDDVSVMTKVAAKKTSGVLGDDLALNAEQVTGVDASREIPVVVAVAKGSFVNKVILVPIALLLSQFLPILIQPLLVIGGLFLCFEGFEKVYEKCLLFFKKNHQNNDRIETKILKLSESDKIKGAIRTDFILSAEIIVITLGTVASESWLKQLTVLALISIIMTFGVYGLVAGIVKLDDLGLYLLKKQKKIAKKVGLFLLNLAPLLLKFLGVAGTIAMFMVGGGLVAHALPQLHHLFENDNGLIKSFSEALLGFLLGGVIVLVIHVVNSFKKNKSDSRI